jgi:hypothetical protein
MSLAVCLQSHDLSQHLKQGLQALGTHTTCVEMRNRKATASVDLDAALQKSAPNTPRWDYGIEAMVGSQFTASGSRYTPRHHPRSKPYWKSYAGCGVG